MIMLFVQDMLRRFENRVVLFDNKTSDSELRQSQINSLFDALDFVLSINDERPFSNEMFLNIQVLLTFSIITSGLLAFSLLSCVYHSVGIGSASNVQATERDIR
jgi:hypothetical protein